MDEISATDRLHSTLRHGKECPICRELALKEARTELLKVWLQLLPQLDHEERNGFIEGTEFLLRETAHATDIAP